ncbi:MAG: hypothetical protein U1E76_03185 [Planctomycetota bacterium]
MLKSVAIVVAALVTLSGLSVGSAYAGGLHQTKPPLLSSSGTEGGGAKMKHFPKRLKKELKLKKTAPRRLPV